MMASGVTYFRTETAGREQRPAALRALQQPGSESASDELADSGQQ
jgi:hypothetical protein